MAVCDIWVYYGVDDDKWEKIQKLCKQRYDIEINGQEGEMEVMGVTVYFKHHPDAEIGEMNVLHKPKLFPCGMIKKIIDDVFYSI